MSETTTPRTDEATHDDWSGGAEAVEPEVSRALEEELNTAKSQLAEAKAENERRLLAEISHSGAWKRRLAGKSQLLEESEAKVARYSEERKELEEYLWPDQTGLPNTYRSCMVAVKARCELSKKAMDAANVERDQAKAQFATAMDALAGIRSVLQFELSQNEKHGQKTTQFELGMFCVQQADRLRKALSAPASQDGETKAVNFMQTVCTCCNQPKDHRELIGTCQACRDKITGSPASSEKASRIDADGLPTEPSVLKRELLAWRILAQEMTPGGSEFMSRDVVRAYYREFKDSAHKAKLNCVKHQARIAEVERERDSLRVEYESRAIWIKQMCDILGYNNDDGFHSEPTPFEIAKTLTTQHDAALARVKELVTVAEDLMDHLEVALSRLGVCGPGDGKDRRADADSWGGAEALDRASAAIRTAMTETGGGE